MDMADVMDELATRLKTIGGGLRVSNHPPDAVNAPEAIVTYPGSLMFDGTYQRGMDTMDPSVVVLVGKVTSRTVLERIAKYCRGSGPSSFKEVLEAGDYTSCDSVRVVSVDFDNVLFGGVEYLAATFTLDIAGQGD